MAERSETAKREAVLEALLPDVPFDGWTLPALMKAGEEAGLSHGEVRLLFPGGVNDVIDAFFARGDALMLEKLQSREMPEKIRERISYAVRTRLEVDAPNREALRRAAAHLALTPTRFTGVKSLYRTVDAIWLAAGDTSTDFNFYTKRALLTGVFVSTLFVWFSDTSEGFADTYAFLERRIGDVMQIEKAKATLGKAVSGLPDPFSLLGRLRYPGAR